MNQLGTTIALFVAVMTVAGCANQEQLLVQRQDEAVQTALQRGRFDLNCPAATGTVLSSDFYSLQCRGRGSAGSSAWSTRSASPVVISAPRMWSSVRSAPNLLRGRSSQPVAARAVALGNAFHDDHAEATRAAVTVGWLQAA